MEVYHLNETFLRVLPGNFVETLICNKKPDLKPVSLIWGVQFSYVPRWLSKLVAKVFIVS